MKGGVILYRGSGADARRYLESDRSRADDYYLKGGVVVAEFSVVGGEGVVFGAGVLAPDEYAQWVDWINPLTGQSMGTPRQAGDGRRGSPRFAEMVVNAPKSLSIAAALHPEVSEALDVAQSEAVAEIRRWLGQHSVTRVGPRGRQEVVSVEQLETVSIVHKTSRAGDPHRHIHFQIGTRVWAAGASRGLDTVALFRQQGAIRALGTAVIAAHPQLAAVLDAHGLSLDPVTGEVAELQPFNAVMSKRGDQVARNLARFEKEWRAAYPGQDPGPVVTSQLTTKAWGHERPHKKTLILGHEDAWRFELEEAGYRPHPERVWVRVPVSLDDLSVQQVASRALDRCAAGASTWTVHTIQEQVTRIITEAGVRAEPTALHDLIALTTGLAVEGCLSVLPPGAPQPDHVAHLTSLHVVAVESRLRELLTARATAAHPMPNVTRFANARGLDPEQARAAAAVASTSPLVVVEGAAGAGKTTMLGVAIDAAAAEGRAVRVVTPTKKAADVAHQELGVATDSVAKLVHEHGWRWNRDGAWTRITVGDSDPDTGATYTGPAARARLVRGERVVVDEVGMLDQDTAVALLTVADECGATVALVGDRAQLAAVGRGGVLDIAAQLAPRVFDITTVHRFADPAYAQLTVRMRAGENPALLFDRLCALGLVVRHDSEEAARATIARHARTGDAITVATNDEARELNSLIRDQRVCTGQVDDTRTTTGSDGLPIGAGDQIQTRKNDRDLQVANRQTWTVHAVGDDGTVWAKENGTHRKRPRTVALTAEYVNQYTHLAYASTAYGVQGVTAPEAHTVLGDALDAPGVYVGMTRGRQVNRLHVVSADVDDARAQFVAALERDRADRGLTAATATAGEAVAALIADGPVLVVNMERARLAGQIKRAGQQAARWEQVARALDRQEREHMVEAETQQALVAATEATAAQVRGEVITPLFEQAAADGAAYLAARTRVWERSGAHRTARGLAKRSAGRAVSAADDALHIIETAVRRRWGSAPQTTDSIESWAVTVTQCVIDTDLRVTETRARADEARRAEQRLTARQEWERARLRSQMFGDRMDGGSARARTALWRARAETDRRSLATIEVLPEIEAAQVIRGRIEGAQREVDERRRRASELHDFTTHAPNYRPPPDRGLGL